MENDNILKKVMKYPFSMTALKACKVLEIDDKWIPRRVRAKATEKREKIFELAQKSIFTKIIIPTYEGFNQTVHPDVVKIQHESKGAYYLMAITPYPYGYDKYENPCLYTSNDGIEWTPIKETPLFLPNKGKANHLSDPELVIYKEKILLYFRECVFGKENFDIIYKSESSNLRNWSQPKKIIVVKSEDGIISPTTVLRDDGLFINFAISKREGLIRNQDTSGEYKNQFIKCKINGEPLNRIIWHIDIKQLKENYWVGLFVYSTKIGGRQTKLFYAESSDLGYSWDIKGEVRLCENQDEIIESVYRSTIVEDMDSESYNIYVSLMTKEYSWHTVLIKQFSKDYLSLDYVRKDAE